MKIDKVALAFVIFLLASSRVVTSKPVVRKSVQSGNGIVLQISECPNSLSSLHPVESCTFPSRRDNRHRHSCRLEFVPEHNSEYCYVNPDSNDVYCQVEQETINCTCVFDKNNREKRYCKIFELKKR